jgi:bifunctional DNA-binding transcriptional regulator/antitoxin component of YhaV-PrlF toxin-antitoxin module
MKYEPEEDLSGHRMLSVQLTKRGELRLPAAFRREFNLQPGAIFLLQPKDDTGEFFHVTVLPARGEANPLAAFRQRQRDMKQLNRELKKNQRPLDYYNQFIPKKVG